MICEEKEKKQSTHNCRGAAERGTWLLTSVLCRTFNTGAPWNVPAGHGSANIEKVIAKYEKEAFEEQAKKLEQVKENKVPAEQPYTPPAGGKMQLM